jgi:hypothetical protein
VNPQLLPHVGVAVAPNDQAAVLNIPRLPKLPKTSRLFRRLPRSSSNPNSAGGVPGVVGEGTRVRRPDGQASAALEATKESLLAPLGDPGPFIA